jgi:hypothetical protein
MSDEIQTICNLTGCSREQAEEVYAQTQNVVDAVDRLLVNVPSPAEKYIQSRRTQKYETEEQKHLRKLREIMEKIEENVKKSTSSNQHGYEGSVETPSRHEEMALQNNCSQECHLPSLESEAQTQGTAYPSQSE